MQYLMAQSNIQRKKISVRETSYLLGVSRNCVYNLVEEGRLDFFYVGKRIVIFEDSVERYIRENRPNKEG